MTVKKNQKRRVKSHIVRKAIVRSHKVPEGFSQKGSRREQSKVTQFPKVKVRSYKAPEGYSQKSLCKKETKSQSA